MNAEEVEIINNCIKVLWESNMLTCDEKAHLEAKLADKLNEGNRHYYY